MISIVVYHGKAEWRVPLALADTVGAGPEVRPWLVDFRYILVDLGHIEDGRLSRNEVLRVGFLVLKYGTRDADLQETLLALGRAALTLGFDDLVATVRYILFEPNEVEAGILRTHPARTAGETRSGGFGRLCRGRFTPVPRQ